MTTLINVQNIYAQYFKDLEELEKKHFSLDMSPYEDAQKFHDNYKFILSQYPLYYYYDFKNIDTKYQIDNLFVIAFLVTFNTIRLINLSA